MKSVTNGLLLLTVFAICTGLPTVDEEELKRQRRENYGFYYPPNTCCPKVVPVTGESTDSVIEAIGGCRAHVAVITAFGTCNIKHEGFWWFIDWGNGEYNEGCTDYFGPFGPRLHTYKSCQKYMSKGYKGTRECITVYYCSSPDSQFQNCTHNADCCDYFKKCINVY